MSSKLPRGLVSSAILIILLSFLIYYKTLNYPWVFDDIGNIIENPKIKSLSYAFKESFNRTRQLGTLSFALNWHYFNDNPAPFRMTNILLHIGLSEKKCFVMFKAC